MTLATSSVHIRKLKKQKNNNKITVTLVKLSSVYLRLKERCQSVWLPQVVWLRIVFNVNFSEPYSKNVTSCSSERFFKVWSISLFTLFKRSNLNSDYSSQRIRSICFRFKPAGAHRIHCILKIVSGIYAYSVYKIKP